MLQILFHRPWVVKQKLDLKSVNSFFRFQVSSI